VFIARTMVVMKVYNFHAIEVSKEEVDVGLGVRILEVVRVPDVPGETDPVLEELRK